MLKKHIKKIIFRAVQADNSFMFFVIVLKLTNNALLVGKRTFCFHIYLNRSKIVFVSIEPNSLRFYESFKNKKTCTISIK